MSNLFQISLPQTILLQVFAFKDKESQYTNNILLQIYQGVYMN